jgi:PAS domain S-box-containing protein
MKDTISDLSFFKLIFETSVEGILVVDEKGNVTMANTASHCIFGYDKGELHGKNVEELIPQKSRKAHKIHWHNYNERPKKCTVGEHNDLCGIKKDGTVFPMDISLNPNYFEGKPITIAFLRDATQREKYISDIKTTNNVLTEVNRKYGTLVDNLQGIVFRSQNDRNWTTEYINEGCKFITGYSPQEFLEGKVHYGKIIVPDDRDKVWNDIQKAIAKKRPFDLAYRIQDKSGNIKYLRERGRGILDQYGNIEALEGFIADITELKNTEEELRGNLAKNKALLEALPDLMFINDFDGNYLDLYTSEPEKLQIPREEVIGKNMKDILPADVHSIYKKVFEKVRETKTGQLLEYTLDERNGSRMYEGRTVHFNEHAFLTIIRDITERKELEKKLFIRNRALKSAANGIVIADAKLRDYPIIYVNNAFYKMSGFDSTEVLGRNFRFLQNCDRDQEAIVTMAKAIQKGESCQVEVRNYKKDGTMFWNEITITPVNDDYGELTHFIGVHNDVTDRKNRELLKDGIRRILEQIANEEPLIIIANTIIEIVEMHLKGSMASLLLLDTERGTLRKLAAPKLPEGFSKGIEEVIVGDNICSCSTAAFLKKEVVVNDIATDPGWTDYKKLALKNGLKSCWSFPILSYKKEVLGTFAMYFDQQRKPQKKERDIMGDIADLASVAIEQHNVNKELELSRKQLEKYSLNLEEKVRERTDELRTTVQKLVETNLSLNDQIQETKAAENRALESQTMFTAISKNFPKGLIIVFNTDFEIVYVDGSELSRLGFDKNQLEGRRIDEVTVLSKQRMARIKEDIEKTMNGEQLSFEVQFSNKTFTVNTSPLQLGNDKTRWTLFVYNDITEQKEANKKIRMALIKEHELNELKSRFISMASHEFRTPLSAISTSAILIAKQNMPGKEEKRVKYVERIRSNVRNLVVILNDFLSLGKLEEGKVQSKPERVDLVEFTNNLIDEMKPNRKEGQKIKLVTQQVTVPVYLDPKLLKHIFTNLLSNAIKYSEKGDQILVKLKKGKEKVSLAVTDQGIGIPIEEQDNLFDRFFRAENSINIQGTGLGLHIVKQYTQLMGGKVSFKSEVGKGSTFLVEFKVP